MKIIIEGTEQEIQKILSTIGSSREGGKGFIEELQTLLNLLRDESPNI